MLEMCGKHLRRRCAVKAKQSGWVPTTEKHPGHRDQARNQSKGRDYRASGFGLEGRRLQSAHEAFLRIAASVNNYADKIIVDATNVLAQAAQH